MADSHYSRAPIALCTVDLQKRFLTVNAGMAALLGFPAESLVGRLVSDFVAGAEEVLDSYHALAEKGAPLRSLNVNWGERRFQLSFGPFINADATLSGLCVAAADISRQARMQEHLRHSRRQLLAAASKDHLTGLLNRRGLEKGLHQEIARAGRAGQSLGILLVDIDFFKSYNDSLGHIAGDSCLKAVAKAIQTCGNRASDAVGRFGGEEFVVILPGTGRSGVQAVAERCRLAVEALAIRNDASNHGRVTVSIGAATVLPALGSQIVSARAAELMKAADRALYKAKHNGRNRIELA